MYKFLNYFIDFIFPPSTEEMKLRNLSPISFLEISPKANPTEFPFIYSIFSYKDPLVRELIWQIKYKKNNHAVKCAAYALYSDIIKKKGPVTLIPIPISNKRRKERGYNQCEIIIDEIMKLDESGFLNKDYNLLVRSKHIDKQTFKNRNERIENTKSIFEIIKKDSIKAKIMIIDDVSTTGSTLKEAREALLKAGFTEVEALTVAH